MISSRGGSPCAAHRRRRRARSPGPASRRSRGAAARGARRACRASGCVSRSSALVVRDELVQRRIEQPDRDRPLLHRLEEPSKSRLLERQQLGERSAAGPSTSEARIIARIFGSRSAAMNMCSVRQSPMPSAPSARARRASAGVSAFARTPSVRSPSHHSSTRSKDGSGGGVTSGTSSSVTAPACRRSRSGRPACSTRSPIRTSRGVAGRCRPPRRR